MNKRKKLKITRKNAPKEIIKTKSQLEKDETLRNQKVLERIKKIGSPLAFQFSTSRTPVQSLNHSATPPHEMIKLNEKSIENESKNKKDQDSKQSLESLFPSKRNPLLDKFTDGMMTAILTPVTKMFKSKAKNKNEAKLNSFEDQGPPVKKPLDEQMLAFIKTQEKLKNNPEQSEVIPTLKGLLKEENQISKNTKSVQFNEEVTLTLIDIDTETGQNFTLKQKKIGKGKSLAAETTKVAAPLKRKREMEDENQVISLSDNIEPEIPMEQSNEKVLHDRFIEALKKHPILGTSNLYKIQGFGC